MSTLAETPEQPQRVERTERIETERTTSPPKVLNDTYARRTLIALAYLTFFFVVGVFIIVLLWYLIEIGDTQTSSASDSRDWSPAPSGFKPWINGLANENYNFQIQQNLVGQVVNNKTGTPVVKYNTSNVTPKVDQIIWDPATPSLHAYFQGIPMATGILTPSNAADVGFELVLTSSSWFGMVGSDNSTQEVVWQSYVQGAQT